MGEKVVIVTDSIAQVPGDLANELGIRIMPFSVAVNDMVFTDGIDLNPGNLYQRMRMDKDLRLSTSAPSNGQFFQVFKDCQEQGAMVIVYVGLSSRLSGSINSAREAMLMMQEEGNTIQVKIFDSRMATFAQGFLAIEAARSAMQGENSELILEELTENRKRAGFAAGLETLEYLARGGRIGKAAYMLSNAIQILPVISINDDGEVAPISRPLGYHNMMKDLIHYVSKKTSGSHHLSLAVMHADALENAEKLRQMAVDQLHPDEIFITDFTPVMVAHTGPGILGLAYFWHPMKDDRSGFF